jgi:uncharacterized protein (TIGR03435 family)
MAFPRLTTLLTLAALPALAQQTTPPASFETASVKSSETSDARCAPNASVGQTFTVKNCSLGNLILYAYDVLQQQVSGQTFLLDEKYDVTAKAAKPVSRVQMKRMLQTLLEDRFKLTLRRETKETPVYALLVDKDGPKFHASPSASDAGPSFVPGTAAQLTLQNAAMADLVFALSRRIKDRFVIDKTGLEGKYDFEMAWYLELGKPNPPPVFTAVQTLGLKLEPQQSPVEYLVILHIEPPPEH